MIKSAAILTSVIKRAAEKVDPAYARAVEKTNSKQMLAPARKPVVVPSPFDGGRRPGEYNQPVAQTPGGR